MSRRVNIVLLCEDTQQEAFLRRFLESMGWDKRRMRILRATGGAGSGEQFVRTRFPAELSSYRQNRNRVANALVVMIDGDNRGVQGRIAQLTEACQEIQVAPLVQDERVAIFVPTSNIETWLAYLDGETVDEARRDYPRLPRERDCRRHVDALVAMCHEKRLRDPAPASLASACDEYRNRLTRP